MTLPAETKAETVLERFESPRQAMEQYRRLWLTGDVDGLKKMLAHATVTLNGYPVDWVETDWMSEYLVHVRLDDYEVVNWVESARAAVSEVKVRAEWIDRHLELVIPAAEMVWLAEDGTVERFCTYMEPPEERPFRDLHI